MMKHLFTAFLFCAAFALGSAELPFLSPAPVIDGKKGDPGWKNALTASFKVKQGKAFLGRSATHLYVAIEVKHGNLEAAANNFVKHDSAVYADDCLDFFFTGAPGSESYSQIIANVRGTIFDHRRDKDCRTDLTWDSGAEAKGSYSKDSFYIEMAVPLAALGCDRHKLAVAVAAYTSWNQQGEALWGQYHKPETFTVFELPDTFPVKVKERRWAYAGGTQSSFITLENTTSRDLLLEGSYNGTPLTVKLGPRAVRELECRGNLSAGREGCNTLSLSEGGREVLRVCRIFTPVRLLHVVPVSDLVYEGEPLCLKISVSEKNAGPVTVEYFPGRAVCTYKGEKVEIPWKTIPSPWR